MTRVEQVKRWKGMQANLERARRLLPPAPGDQAADFCHLLSEYNSYLERNELELALDMLQQLGDLLPCPGGYWRNLERAAETVELHARIPYLRQQFEQARRNP